MDSAGKVMDWGHLHVCMYNAHSTQWYMHMYVSLNSTAISIIPIHYTTYMYPMVLCVKCILQWFLSHN